MMCISCERTNAQPSVQMPTMCARCWSGLPQITRELYLHGGLDRHRLTVLSKARNASLRTIGGGAK